MSKTSGDGRRPTWRAKLEEATGRFLMEPQKEIKRTAPSLEDFATLSQAAFGRLPDEMRAIAEEVAFKVADLPDNKVVNMLGADSPFDILGLFEGLTIGERASAPANAPPSQIWLYRRSILQYWFEYNEPLEDIITYVLVYQIGYYFGFSDEEIDLIEARGT